MVIDIRRKNEYKVNWINALTDKRIILMFKLSIRTYATKCKRQNFIFSRCYIKRI